MALLGVDSDPDPKAARGVLAPGWRSWWDRGTTGPIAQDYAVVVYPTLFVIDQNGTIVARFEKEHFNQQLCERVKALVRRLLQRGPEPALEETES